MKWLLLSDWLEKIMALEKEAVAHAAEISAREKTKSPGYVLRDGVATIAIEGVLLKARSRWLDYFGVTQTSYDDIISHTREAAAGGAGKIIYDINSPGGNVSGLVGAMDAIRNAGVETQAISRGTLASAAYMLASQAGSIEADSEDNAIGSIGVVTTRSVSSYSKDITNTQSKNKRPDVGTEDGVKAVEAELDDFYGLIVERIAKGRGTTVDAINKNYGNGAVMTARTALKKGIIDSISSQNEAASAKASASEDGVEAMNLEELKAKYPALCEALYASGVAAGKQAEKDRVSAHLILAKESGDTDTAYAAIESGDGVTDLIRAKYLAASMKKSALVAREEDDPGEIGNRAKSQKTLEEQLSEELSAYNKDVEWEVR